MQIRIMTFNLRFENPRDGDNAWENRRRLVVELIKRYLPCILGTQEGTSRQLSYLQTELKSVGYELCTGHRPVDESCQYPTLFYRNSRVHLTKCAEFWLSKTPSVHRSKSWDSAFPRMMSYAYFEAAETRKSLLAVVTHLDHIGSEARREQAAMIAEFIRKHPSPTILMGDFNSIPGSAVHRLLTAPDGGLRDTWQLLGRSEDEASMTHHGFIGVPQKGRLDWILVSKEFRVLDAAIIRDDFEGRYPSDHFPYMVDLDWSG